MSLLDSLVSEIPLLMSLLGPQLSKISLLMSLLDFLLRLGWSALHNNLGGGVSGRAGWLAVRQAAAGWVLVPCCMLAWLGLVWLGGAGLGWAGLSWTGLNWTGPG